MGSRIDGFLAESARTFVEERDDGFVFLTDQGDKVRLAIVVEVRDGYVDRAVALVHSMRDEPRLRPVRRLIFQVKDLTALAPAEDGDHEIDSAVAVEVGRAHVGDPADIL